MHMYQVRLVFTTARTGYMAPIQGVSQQEVTRLVQTCHPSGLLTQLQYQLGQWVQGGYNTNTLQLSYIICLRCAAFKYVKDFCVARFLHIGTIEGTTLAKINLE